MLRNCSPSAVSPLELRTAAGHRGDMTGGDIATQRVLNGLVSLELTQRADVFEAVIKALKEQAERWSRPGDRS